MSLLDGPEVVQLFPEVEGTDEDGNPVRVPDMASPVLVFGSMQPTGSSADDRDGQGVDTGYRLLCRSFPAGAWAMARWGGRDWDVDGEPRVRGDSPATAHATVLLTARTPKAVPS